jgi:superfamily I DNA/RNA helicase
MKTIAVYGVPGTGKTTFLLKKYSKVSSSNPFTKICYWTFRKNMAEDFVARLGKIPANINASTIHSICFRLLAREFGLTRKNVALPWVDFVKFCRGRRIPISEEDLFLDEEECGEDRETVGGKIYTIYTNCVNTLTPFEKWRELPDYMRPEFDRIPKNYASVDDLVIDTIDGWIRYLEKHDKVDFAQMLYKAYELRLKPDMSIAMSDESHDMTPIQVALTKLWTKDVDEFYVAMDINQTIYSFWGTTPDFCKEIWKKADERIVLSPSHRISQEVYEFARNVLRMSGQTSPDVECVGKTRLWFCPAERFLEAVRKLKPAILARTRFQLKRIAQILRDSGMIFTGVYGWSDRMISVYRTVWLLRKRKPVSGKDFEAFLDAYPTEFFKVKKHRLKSVMPSKLDPDLVFNVVTPYFKTVLLKRKDPFSFVNRSAFNQRAIDAMNEALAKGIEPVVYAELHTIHGAKGLEWDYVLVVDGITPRIKKSIRQYREEFENECRVWYVAFTRARKLLGIVDYSLIDRNIPFVIDRSELF